jgi:ABC-type uncharacterized transport system auxiliary subunit
MHRLIRFTLVALALTTLCRCLGGRPIRYYTVTIPPSPAPQTSVYPVTLLIGHIGAPEILEDQPIVYRSGQNEIGTYQYHQWAEPPAQMVKLLLIRRLRSSGGFQSVAPVGSSAQGEFLLRGRLYNFEEVDKDGSITALVSMEFELYERKTHKAVWHHFYSHTEPVQGKAIPNVVAALDHNLEQGLSEILSGLDTYFSGNTKDKP